MVIIDSLADPQVVLSLQEGKVGVLPTDTIFGIVARAVDPAAVKRLYRIKHREGKPGTLIAANTGQLIALGLDPTVVQTVRDAWPNPVSIVLPAPDVLDYLHMGKASLAVRIPSDVHVRALLEKTGVLLTSSANQPGELPSSNIEQAQKYFGEEVDFYVRGDTSDREASTVLRLRSDGQLEVLRQGQYLYNQRSNNDI